MRRLAADSFQRGATQSDETCARFDRMSGTATTTDHSFWVSVGPETAWVHRQLRRLGVRPADLDDQAQEVLVDVFRKWSQFDQTRALRPWLYGFIVNVVGDYRRRPHLRRESFDEP